MSTPAIFLLISFGFVTFLLRFLFALSRERRTPTIYRTVITSIDSRSPLHSSSNRTLITKRDWRTHTMPVSLSQRHSAYRVRLHL